MRRKLSKPPAEGRTIDMFSGHTKAEEQEPELSEEDTKEVKAPGEKTIEASVDRYRAQAFVGQEWTSRLFPTNNTENGQSNPDIADAVSAHKTSETDLCLKTTQTSFRLSSKDGWLYLEQLRFQPGLQPGSQAQTKAYAYHYAGVMFPAEELEGLTKLFVQCARAHRTASSATTSTITQQPTNLTEPTSATTVDEKDKGTGSRE